MNKSQYQNVFSTLLQLKDESVSPFGPFYYRTKWPISVTFHIPQLVKSEPFHILEALSGGASPYRSYREYPRPLPPDKNITYFFLEQIDWHKIPKVHSIQYLYPSLVEFIIWHCNIFWISSDVNVLARRFLVCTFRYSLVRKVCLN